MFESGIDTEHPFGHHGSVSRTRVRRRRATFTVLSVAVASLLVGPIGHVLDAGATVRHPRTVVVQAGDSLWAIAHRAEPTADPRETIDAITAASGIQAGTLVPGQRLVVPVP